jgi:hypothetical protein
VQLHQVDRVDSEVGSRAIVPGEEVLPAVVLRHLVDAASHLGRHGDLRVAVFAEEAADLRLASAVAVDVCGVQEGDPRFYCGAQHAQGVVLVDLSPVGAELPAAQPDHADGSVETCQAPLLHSGSAAEGRPQLHLDPGDQNGRPTDCARTHAGRT